MAKTTAKSKKKSRTGSKPKRSSAARKGQKRRSTKKQRFSAASLVNDLLQGNLDLDRLRQDLSKRLTPVIRKELRRLQPMIRDLASRVARLETALRNITR